MLFDGISKDTRRLEKAYVDTIKLGQRIGLDPDLQVKLDQFRQHLGRNVASSRLTDLDKKYGKSSAIDEEFVKNPVVAKALSEDGSGELKSTLKSFGEVVRALPAALRGVVATALLYALSEVYKATHGEELPRPQQARPAQAQTPVKVAAEAVPIEQKTNTRTIEQKVMEVLRSSPDVDVPKHTNTVKEWAEYLAEEKQQVEQGVFLRSRGMEPVPEGGFIVVDVPKHAAPRVFNFRSEAELVAAADATGLKWRAEGWHPVTAVGQSLLDLGNRERVGLYRSMNEAVTDTLQPENSRGRGQIISQLKQLSGEGEKVSEKPTVEEGIPRGQREDLIEAMRTLERMDDGVARIDGVGFRSQHLEIGRELAAKKDLTQSEASVARDLALFYSKQLKEVEPELLERATAGRGPRVGELDAESLRARMKARPEPAEEKVQPQIVEVGVPGRALPQRERAEAIETVATGQSRRAGVSV